MAVRLLFPKWCGNKWFTLLFHYLLEVAIDAGSALFKGRRTTDDPGNNQFNPHFFFASFLS